MGVPTAPGAAQVVGSLVAEIETELDALVARTGDRIRDRKSTRLNSSHSH